MPFETWALNRVRSKSWINLTCLSIKPAVVPDRPMVLCFRAARVISAGAMKKLVKAALMHSAIGRWAGKIPFVRKLYIRYVWSGQMNALYGVFDSFPRAEGFAEGVNQVGWGNDAMAELLVRTSDLAAPQTFQTSQFAVMLWLSKLMRQGSTILDLGGSGGIFYEICNRYGLLNSPLRWHVVDMPDMVERGRQRHAGLQSTMISFGSVLSDAPAGRYHAGARSPAISA